MAAASAAIETGKAFPDLTLHGTDGQAVKTSELFAGKKVVITTVPGAFTPTCSNVHIPGYVEAAAGLKAKGADLVIVAATNDFFVMKAWQANLKGEALLFLADMGRELANALGEKGSIEAFGEKRLSRATVVVENNETKLVAFADGDVDKIMPPVAEAAL